MTVTAGDFGILGDLAAALGILRDGSPDPGWFGDPAGRLRAVLGDDDQRDALVRFLDSVLDDGAVRHDGDRVVLPVVHVDDPDLTVSVLIEPHIDVVRVGVVVELEAAAVAGAQARPQVNTSIEAMLFQTRRGNAPSVDPLLAGQPGGRVRLAVELTLGHSPASGDFDLGGIAAIVDVPTAEDDEPPVLGLRLTGLQLPGSAPRDVVLDAAGVGSLDDAIIDLVVGLVQAQAASAGGALADVATLFGLAGAVPPLPVAGLRSGAVDALVTWYTSVIGDAAAHTAWLGALASLLPQGAAVVGDSVEGTFGDATVRLRVGSVTGPTGQPRLTPEVDVELGQGGRLVRGHLMLFTLDVATGAVTAVPQLAVWGHLGRTPGGAEPVVLDAPAVGPTPAVRVEAVRAGFALDAARKPTFVLAADVVDIGAHSYPTLDLTSTDTLMDVAGTVADDVLDQLLDQLGDVADTVRMLLGLSAPQGHPGVATVSLADILGNPLDAVAGYWHGVLTTHADAVPVVLGVLRNVLASAASAALPVLGSGSADDPWRVPVTDQFELHAYVVGDEVHVSVAGLTRVDTLGQGCTVVEGTLALELAVVDLAARSAQVMTGATAAIRLSGRGLDPERALLDLGPVRLEADYVRIVLGYRASGDSVFSFDAPGLCVVVEDDRIPLALPNPGDVLDDLAWDGVERLIGLVSIAAPPALAPILDLFGWTPGDRPRLRLADLVGPAADAPTAIGRWLGQLAVVAGPALVSFIADLITSSGVLSGMVSGSGTRSQPFMLPLDTTPRAPELLVWFPGAAGGDPFVVAGDEITTWRPGQTGLASEILARSLSDQATVDDDVFDLIWNRPVAAGLDALVSRWTGTDGRIVPPADPPDDVDVVVLDDVPAGNLAAEAELTELLDHDPPVVIRVRIVTDATTAFPDAPPDRVIDLTAANRAPESFAAPTLSAGDWYVALAPRPVAALAAGDPDGSRGQAARLSVVLAAAAGLGDGQVVIGEGGAGHAARMAAVDAQAVSDVVTLGTPLGPVAFSVLDEAAAGDAWRLLDTLSAGVDPGDADLMRGRALVDALAEIDSLADPARDLRLPAGGIPARAGLSLHAVFGRAGEAAVRRSVTALVAAGLAARARDRADAAAAENPSAGIRLALRTPIADDGVDSLVVSGSVTTDLAGWDITDDGLTTSTERAVRASLRLGVRSGWLAGGPDPQRGLTRPRHHAVRAVTAEVTVPRGSASTAVGQGRVTILDGRVFDTVRVRSELSAAGEPVGAEARLLLSLATARIAAEAAAPAPSASAAALRTVLEAATLVAADGSIADAIEQLIHDPGGLFAAVLDIEARRNQLAAGARVLLGAAASGPPNEVRIATGTVTAVADLAARALTVEAPDANGGIGWAAHAADSPGGLDWWLRVGRPDPSTSPSGAVWLTANPRAVVFHRRPTRGAEVATELWPTFDAATAADTVLRLAPALFAQSALDMLRQLDDDARPIVDAVLAAVGLIDSTGRVRLPLGLMADPVGWLGHPDVLGTDPGRLIALVEAVKPLLGVGGDPGRLDIAPGVRVAVREAGGAFELHASVDTSGFQAPAATPLGRLVAGLEANARFVSGAKPHPAFDLHLGAASPVKGRRAVHVAIDDELSVFLRPASGADVALHPHGRGLGALADQAVTAGAHALPFVLDKLAAQGGNNLSGHVGQLVAVAGDALGLRDPADHFDYDKLVAFAANPSASLVTAASTTVDAELNRLAAALTAALPAAVAVAPEGPALRIDVGVVTVRWTPAPFTVEIEAAADDVPLIENLHAAVTLVPGGLDAVMLEIGPAPLAAGPLQLRPVVAVHAGANPQGGRRVEAGVNLDGTRSLVAQWLPGSPAGTQLALTGGPSPVIDPAAVTAALTELAATVAASIALAVAEVQNLLDTAVGTSTVKELLHGVVLHDDDTFDAELFAASGLVDRVGRLLANLAEADLSVAVDNALTLGLAKPADVGELTLGLTSRLPLVDGDVTIWLEADDTWIDPAPPVAGIALGLVTVNGQDVSFTPTLTVSGLGVRIGRESGPLLDSFATVESVALHLFADISAAGVSGGAQLQLANLAAGLSSANGGNAIASGILADSASAGKPPKPAFSPALAVQKHDGQDLEVTLRAGAGDGPWWVVIQKGFGPLYVEQIGFGVKMPQRHLEAVSLLLDARVSLFGLNAAVDDLSITYFVAKGSAFEPKNWEVDLAGLAVSADLGPLSISGGLLKSGSGDAIEYLGMLLGRFGVYGLTVYGGYGKTAGVVSFFAVGAVVGPIGGVPAFFVTGIGGGFGINRELRVPTDLSQFADYPLIKALDVSATPAPDPMAELRALGNYFPAQPGTFWFAAGLSFTSFALVDGIAVVAMQFGDGFDITMLGLARMALPRPQAALVSIELALVVRISSKEGVIWVQGQLTDNSWLLYEDVRLTGGFAFVVWFGGPHRGEVVLTIGGFHPDFHRDGYPQVPRLGLQWSIGSAIVIKGGAYFALTSEAVMAGVDVKVSADFGWAWARLTFGAHGIVFYDPFHYKVKAYARIAAGVTIDTWFGDITISISRGASIEVEGPDFHGRAKIDVGPCTVTVPFGSTANHATVRLRPREFIAKYLDEASAGVAQAVSSIVTSGAVRPRTSGGPAPQTPDGSQGRPFVVTAEFVMTLTSTVPTTGVDTTGARTPVAPTRLLGIGPMGTAAIDPTFTLRWTRGGAPQPWPFGAAKRLPFGAFPLGVWGPPQDPAAPRVPSGEVVGALNQLQVVSRAVDSGGGPPIAFNRLDPSGPRRPLPFLRNSGATRTEELDKAARVVTLVDDAVSGAADVRALANSWRADGGASPIELVSWQNERRGVPPRLGSLSDRLAAIDDNLVPDVATPVIPPAVDATVLPPVALAVLGAGTALEGALAGGATTVSDLPRVRRAAPPTLAGLRNVPAAARLVIGGAGVATRTSIAPVDAPAVTRLARTPAARVAQRGGAGRDRLEALTAGLAGTPDGEARRPRFGPRAAPSGVSTLRAGEVAVLALPNAGRDVDEAAERPTFTWKGCSTRVVALSHGGLVLSDETTAPGGGSLTIPRGTERLVVAALGEHVPLPSMTGWHAGMTLSYTGFGVGLGIGAIVQVEAAPLVRKPQLFRAGYVEAAELVDGTATVSTRFAAPVDVVIVVLDDPAADAGRRLIVGLDGARQATSGGAAVPPVTLALGNRAMMAYRVVSDGGGRAEPRPITVTIASGVGWALAGVVGANGDAADALSDLATRGFDAVLGAASGGRGEVELGWTPVPDARPVRRIRRARKAQP
ncbi:DUF6603 domain-containing protein [Mycolicibacterium stellerae]|uniref:DUF6603 domain-containing protein n=1 Tax=Mycolicibacterium stellerae TaxID=2358193 RepID=UPI000F0BD691|nr:DUF6603 domain-containing protein [Mycolicibacterium stellerae]